MNKRKKKKEYKKLAGENPPKWMSYHGETYHCVIQKQWGGSMAAIHPEDLMRETRWQQETIRNLEGFNRAMTERRRQWMRRKWNHS